MIDRQSMKSLIPDLIPDSSTTLSMKRIKFIRGGGIIVYDNRYAVEILIPENKEDCCTFFDVFHHQGRIKDYMYTQPKMTFYHISHSNVDQKMKDAFEEALFQYQPFDFSAMTDNVVNWTSKRLSKSTAKERSISLSENLGQVA